MDDQTYNLLVLITQILVALGTIAVAIVAIWGERFKSWFASPKIVLSLNNPKGELTKYGSGERTIYYHILVKNSREWSPAQNVRVMCVGISKRRPDGKFSEEYLAAPDQLAWRFPQFHELTPTVISSDICDLGSVDEKGGIFRLAQYIYPNSFKGSITANSAMRVSLVATGSNFLMKKPCVIEVSWDGKWSSDLEEMKTHLVIKAVANLVGA